MPRLRDNVNSFNLNNQSRVTNPIRIVCNEPKDFSVIVDEYQVRPSKSLYTMFSKIQLRN